jgi:hypothetical protein
MTSSAAAAGADAIRTVLVYSDDEAVRERIELAVGRRPASDVGRLEYVEAATWRTRSTRWRLPTSSPTCCAGAPGGCPPRDERAAGCGG